MQMPSPQHPHYDEVGVTYDGGFFYSDGLPDVTTPNPKKNKTMASLALNLSRLNQAQLLAQAFSSSNALAPTAPATPPIPNMSAKAASLKTKHDAAKAKNDAYEAQKTQLAVAKSERDSAFDELRDELRSVASAVEAEAKGDETLLAASAFPLAGTPAASQVPSQIQNMVLTAGDEPGSVDGTFDPEPNSKTYEWELTIVHPVDGPYNQVALTTASSTTISGQSSGQRVWVRVRGIGSKGTGPWSDPATKIVP